MRSLGVTRVDGYCACGWQASVDVSALPAEMAVPSIKDRLRCSVWCPADGDAAGLVAIPRTRQDRVQTNGVDVRQRQADVEAEKANLPSVRLRACSIRDARVLDD
jgi:hypothetical protein